jgi:hypothetical protein
VKTCSRSVTATAWLWLLVQSPQHAVATPTSAASRRLSQASGVNSSESQWGSDMSLTVLAPYTAIYSPPDAAYIEVSSVSEVLAAVSEESRRSDSDEPTFIRVSSDVKVLDSTLKLTLNEGEAMVFDCQGAVMHTEEGFMSSEQPVVPENTFLDIFHCIIFEPPNMQPGAQTTRYNDCRIIFPCSTEVRSASSRLCSTQ